MNILRHIKLVKYNTYGINGVANYFYVVKNVKAIINCVKWAKSNKIKIFILGGGSNILINDREFDGLIIKMENDFIKYLSGSQIEVGAGELLSKLVLATTKNNLTGMEWAIGIPGTVGGAICGNAGAYGQSISEFVKKVKILDVKTMKIKIVNSKFCKFQYRGSIFKNNSKFIIISVILKFKKGNKKTIDGAIKNNIIQRQNRIPSEPSAGCVFKNIKLKGKKISTGQVIEECGLKGKVIGGAKISEKHANFIVNIGGATANDILRLINLVKKTVKLKTGIILKEEIVYLK